MLQALDCTVAKSQAAKRAVHTSVPCDPASVTPSRRRPRAEGPPPFECEGAACGPVPGLSPGAAGFPDTRGGKRGGCTREAAGWELRTCDGDFGPQRIRGWPRRPWFARTPEPSRPAPWAAQPRPRQRGPARRVAKGSDVTARWRRLLQAAEGRFRPGISESIRDGERASGAGGGRSRGGGARTVPSAPY